MIEACGLLAAAHGEDVGQAAAAMAEIVLGRSVALRLNPHLANERRDAAKLFLEKVIQVSDNLEATASRRPSASWRTLSSRTTLVRRVAQSPLTTSRCATVSWRRSPA